MRLEPTTFAVAALLTANVVFAQTPKTPAADELKSPSKPKAKVEKKFIGFEDKNGDGINDRFRDADGDGRNDVNNQPYPHKFEFKDANKDKINDLWVDRDGDGVNDLAPKLKGKARNAVHLNVLDADEDGHNDVTGAPFEQKKRRWMGQRWGFWNERTGKVQGRFIDADGDGIDDRLSGRMPDHAPGMHRRHMRDVFIDEDGDGIADRRSDFIRRMGQCGRRDRGNRGNREGGHR